MTTASDSADKAHVAAGEASSEAHDHQHRDVSGGWLRPAVFGAMDGLVTNVALIAGVSGGGGSPHALLLAGLAGLAAGAFSMAAGEFVSVSSQNELVAAEVRKEKYELETHPDAERRELAAAWTLTWPTRWPGRCRRARTRRSGCTSGRSSASITRSFRPR